MLIKRLRYYSLTLLNGNEEGWSWEKFLTYSEGEDEHAFDEGTENSQD